jgi:cholesterol transport system auxiliary component
MTRTVLTLDRRFVLLGSGALVLTGCGDLLGPPPALQLYMLKPPTGPSTGGPLVTWQLAVGLPIAAEHLDSPRIAITRGDTTADFYAESAWTDHLPVLVQNALVEAFENSGRIQAVSADGEGFHADYMLQTELREFQARYDTPDGPPTAVVRVEAKLAPTLGRQIVQSLPAVHEVKATENTVPAAVRALDEALANVLAQIVNWALAAPVPSMRRG